MSAPTITRTRIRHLRSRADQLADRVEAGEALCVSVVDRGPGWYVLDVDRAAGKVVVRRGGSEMTVGWSTIQEL